jgi:hypothetical protein
MPRFDPSVIASDELYDMRVETTLEITRLQKDFDTMMQGYMRRLDDEELLMKIKNNGKRRKLLDNKKFKIVNELCRRDIQRMRAN